METTEAILKLQRDVHQILELLRGNDLDRNDGGLVGIVSKNKDRIEKLEKLKDRFTWILIGMTAPTSFGIMQLVGWVFDKIK